MKVSDLIQQLTHMDPEAEALFSYNYGDYTRTDVASRIDRVDAGYVVYSDYHQMDKIADEEYDTNEDTGEWEEGVRQVVILR